MLDRLSSDNANTEYECLLGAPLAPGKRRSSYDSHPYVRSAKKRRISLASVDLSREIQLPDEMILRTGTTVSTRVFFFSDSLVFMWNVQAGRSFHFLSAVYGDTVEHDSA